MCITHTYHIHMNIIKSFSNLFSYSVDKSQVFATDIEDIHKDEHKDKDYKENSIFNGLQESIAREFEKDIENFKTTSDIDKFTPLKI